MLNWAWRQWLLQPGRLLLTMVVFAGVLALAMLFDGIRIGIVSDIREFPASLSSDLVALKKGNSYFAMTPSSLPATALAQARAVTGVAQADPIGLVPFILSNNGKRTPAMLVAYGKAGGPPRLVSGRTPGSGPEIVLDANLARLYNFSLGDKVDILGNELTIVGISTGTTSPFTPYAFISYDQFVQAALRMLLSGQMANQASDMSLISALLIKLDDGADINAVRQRLETAMPEVGLFTPAQLGNADASFGERLMGPILVLLSVMTWLIALLTMVVLRHAEVQNNLRQFGIQKALGARPAGLAVALAFGGVLIALSAFPLALVAARGLAYVMADWNPLYGARVWDPYVLVRALIVALVAAIAGGILPWRRLVKLDPVMVFKR
ncbi:hypothetical protein MNBD_ALPHA12-1074 [hydrothermal vent metagenome]|uniref:Uncharacterized protein n=1 Tax=hydrothermal vent metagenome TaxID=652676 RepID=A0A3B0TJJ1_9ZZZZ